MNRIYEICDNEGLKYNTDGLEAAFKLCEGDMRKVVNMLQSLALSSKTKNQDLIIDANYIYDFTGNATP